MVYSKLFHQNNLWVKIDRSKDMKQKKKNTDPLQELHAIREQNYKETKNMSPSEYISCIRKKASKVSKNLKKLKVISSPDDFYITVKGKRAS